jgi:hypothetical protein
MFKELINIIYPMLKQQGFSKVGNKFYLEKDGNLGLIDFQKSKESNKESVLFTINFGIYSSVLGQFQYGYTHAIKPEIDQCHWQSRVGNFMPNSPDYWWKLEMPNDFNTIASNVVEVIQDSVMPEIVKRLSDDGLISCWMNNAFAGTTEIGRFKNLTTLLKLKGDNGTLNLVVKSYMEKSKGKPNASIAAMHLKDIKFSE